MSGSVAPPRVVNIEDLRRLREAAAAARRLRLHRRRRRWRDHAARELPRLRRHRLPAALRRRDAGARPAHDGARHAARAAVHPRAGRQQPDVLSARRRGRGARRRRRRHDLHAVDAVGLPARRREGGDDRAGLVPALSRRRPRRRAAAHRARAQGRATPRSSSPSTRRSPACASATSATARRSC